MASRNLKWANKIRPLPILYECPHFIIVNKPPFVHSQPPGWRDFSRAENKWILDGGPDELMVILKSKHPALFEPKQNPYTEPKLVHRLDYQVSGAILLATSKQAAKYFSRGLKSQGSKGWKMHKRYMALLEPSLYREEGVQNKESPLEATSPAWLYREKLAKHPHVVLNEEERPDMVRGDVTMSFEDKASLTRFALYPTLHSEDEKDKLRQNLLLGLFEPVSGRKHQIRKHCSYGLGMPIVGDEKYGGMSRSSDEVQSPIALHSATLAVEFGNSKVSVRAPVWNRELWKGFVDEEGFVDERLYNLAKIEKSKGTKD